MSSIHNIHHLGSTGAIHPAVPRAAANVAEGADAAAARGKDRLELSGLSPMLKTLRRNDLRADKVANIKAQIEAGTYEDDKKLDVATDRLLDDLLKS